jgi:hypothetical protein
MVEVPASCEHFYLNSERRRSDTTVGRCAQCAVFGVSQGAHGREFVIDDRVGELRHAREELELGDDAALRFFVRTVGHARIRIWQSHTTLIVTPEVVQRTVWLDEWAKVFDDSVGTPLKKHIVTKSDLKVRCVCARVVGLNSKRI